MEKRTFRAPITKASRWVLKEHTEHVEDTWRRIDRNMRRLVLIGWLVIGVATSTGSVMVLMLHYRLTPTERKVRLVMAAQISEMKIHLIEHPEWKPILGPVIERLEREQELDEHDRTDSRSGNSVNRS